MAYGHPWSLLWSPFGRPWEKFREVLASVPPIFLDLPNEYSPKMSKCPLKRDQEKAKKFIFQPSIFKGYMSVFREVWFGDILFIVSGKDSDILIDMLIYLDCWKYPP